MVFFFKLSKPVDKCKFSIYVAYLFRPFICPSFSCYYSFKLLKRYKDIWSTRNMVTSWSTCKMVDKCLFFRHLFDNKIVDTSDFTNWLTHWFSGLPIGRKLKIADIAMFDSLFDPVRIVISGYIICQKIKHDLKIDFGNFIDVHWK